MNGFDIVTLLALGSSSWRGYRRGLASECYRLFRMLVALLAGSGVYSLLSDAVTGLLGAGSAWSDPALFVGSSVAAWSLLKRLRQGMESAVAKWTPPGVQKLGGAVAAAAKTALVAGGLVATFDLADWLPGHDAVARDSRVSQVVRPFLPEP